MISRSSSGCTSSDTRGPQESASIYEWCNSFRPLIRTFLRISQTQDLSNVELQRVNKLHHKTQITDFEQDILAQANDKWKPITLADGAFALDEPRGTSQLRTRSSRCGSTSPLLLFWSTWFLGWESKASRCQRSSRTSRFR